MGPSRLGSPLPKAGEGLGVLGATEPSPPCPSIQGQVRQLSIQDCYCLRRPLTPNPSPTLGRGEPNFWLFSTLR